MLVALLPVLFSCRKPKDSYAYADINHDTDSIHLYVFDMQMDEKGLYDSEICCRYYPDRIESSTLDLLVTVFSPSGESYSETLRLPIFRKEIKGDDRVKVVTANESAALDASWLYCQGIQVSEGGRWRLNLKILDKNIAKEIVGIGFHYKNNTPYERKRQTS